MEEAEHPQTISFVYEKAEGKRTVPVTGAFGGPTPDGNSVVAHTYIEHGSVPSVITHHVGEGGKVNLQQGDSISRGDATREVQTTLVMSPEAAMQFGQWLMEKGKLARKMREDRESRN